MRNPNGEFSPQAYARIAGVFYLLIIILGGIDEAVIRSKLIVSGDVTATVQNIMAHKTLFRWSIAGDLLMHVFDIPGIVIFYVLLKPVNKHLSVLAAFFNLVQTAILGLNKVYLLTALSFLGNEEYLKVFNPHQLQALGYLSLDVHESGYGIGLIFFGFTCLIVGYLMFKSGYFPKVIGVMQIFAGVSYLINSFAQIVSPAFASSLFPYILVPAFVGELSTCLWLLIKGINVSKWKEYILKPRIIIALFFLLMASICKGQSPAMPREFYDKDFKWRVSIPDGFELVPDSLWEKMQNKGAAAVEKTYDMKVENHAKTIFVFTSDKFDYFESNYQPFDPAKDGDYFETCKKVDDLLYGTFKAQLPNVKIDTSYTIEDISDLKFYVFNISIHINELATLHLMMYSHLFGKKEFTVNIMYVDAEKGKTLLGAWKASVFGK